MSDDEQYILFSDDDKILPELNKKIDELGELVNNQTTMLEHQTEMLARLEKLGIEQSEHLNLIENKFNAMSEKIVIAEKHIAEQSEKLNKMNTRILKDLGSEEEHEEFIRDWASELDKIRQERLIIRQNREESLRRDEESRQQRDEKSRRQSDVLSPRNKDEDDECPIGENCACGAYRRQNPRLYPPPRRHYRLDHD